MTSTAPLSHTIKQKVIPIAYEGPESTETYIVKRMAWKPQQEFFRLLSQLIASTLKLPDVPGEYKLAALVKSIGAQLPDLLARSTAITDHLLQYSVGLDAATAGGLDGGLVLELIRAALEANFDDQTKNSFAGIVAAVMGAVPAAPKAQTT